ncbi:MAG: GntR family transcriptional regulator [Bacteroidales bacterium]|nr:GntR family transcriptional regulator [Bacteroidales bacterium]
MLSIGKFNTLNVVKQLDFGIYLNGYEEGEILMPKRYVPPHISIGDTIEAFIYRDSEDKLIATTEMPYAQVDEFAFLEVVAVNQMGAFLDWGLPKNLLVPFREQKIRLKQGDKALVFIYLDEKTKRIVASANIEQFLSKKAAVFSPQEKVKIIPYKITDLGYKSIVNQQFDGMLYKNEVFQNINIGKTYSAYIKQIRTDGKIDLNLYKIGYNQVVDFSSTLLEILKNNNGFLHFTDKSSAEEINEEFGVSKKIFKKAVGDLYKKRLIRIENNGLFLIY